MYEHSRLLEEIGVSSALLHDDRWCTDERTVMVLAEHETLGIVGGLRLQHAAPERRLPVHVALGSRDTGIEKLVENARPGMAELCGLWNARRFAGRGVPWMMTSAAVAAAPRAGVHQLLCLAADYTMKYPLMNGFRVLSQVGEKGAFSYPIPGYTSYLLCHPDTSAMVAGDSTHFRRLNDLRRNTGITMGGDQQGAVARDLRPGHERHSLHVQPAPHRASAARPERTRTKSCLKPYKRPMQVSSFVAASAACLAVSAQTASPVTFGATAEDTFIGKQTGILGLILDGLMDIRAALSSKSFQVSDQDVPNLAISSAAHWLRFDLTNASQEPVLLLTLPYSEIEELDVYMARSGATTLIGHTGQARALGDRVGSDPNSCLRSPCPRTKGARSCCGSGHETDPRALEGDGTRRFDPGAAQPVAGGLRGHHAGNGTLQPLRVRLDPRPELPVLCALHPRDLRYAAFRVGHRSSLPVARSSMALIVILHHSCAWDHLLGVQFARRFMDMRSYTPRLNRITPLFFILGTIILMVYLFADASTGYKMTQGLSGLSALFLLTVAVIALRQGSRQAGFFLAIRNRTK